MQIWLQFYEIGVQVDTARWMSGLSVFFFHHKVDNPISPCQCQGVSRQKQGKKEEKRRKKKRGKVNAT